MTRRLVRQLNLFLAFVLHATTFIVHAIPSPQSLDADVSILTYNDLHGNESAYQTSFLVLTPIAGNYYESKAKCEALGESPWQPTLEAAKLLMSVTAANPSLSTYWPGYWAARGDEWQIINSQAQTFPGDRRLALPAICTNDAPITSLAASDNSTQWQIAVDVGSHSITGYRDKYSFRFEGIRYAAEPPRFAYSEIYDPAENVTALSFGPQCLQAGSGGSEDCLFLNVWTPFLPQDPSSSTTLKPVLFWIHGGAFAFGTGSDPTFDGGAFASRGDVVFVTINYRLGTLGFTALVDGKTNGNFGLADQITALDWARKYIRSFGGDPDQITIMGQSAGAGSVRALLASPVARGKFSKAVMMSNLAGIGYGTTFSEYYTIPEVVQVATNPLLNATGCTNATSQLDCLRSVNASILTNVPNPPEYLVVDGTYLTSTSLDLSSNGSAASVPILMGTMRDDGAAFISYPSANSTLTTSLNSNLGALNLTTAILADPNLFPIPQGPNTTLSTFNLTARVATDGELLCLDQSTAYIGLKNDVFPSVHYYEFNRSYQITNYNPNAPVCEPAPTAQRPYGDPDEEYFKCHSGELYYVFGTLAFFGLPDRDGRDFAFSQYVLDGWASFVRTGDPNPDPSWLEVRAYNETIALVEQNGLWDAVDVERPRLREFQWVGGMVGFKEGEQCEVLGLGLEYYGSA